MRFESVRLESFAHHLPEAVLSSEEIERRLAPLYERLRLNAGRLELMSGIRERRAYPRGTAPSAIAAAAGELALARASLPRERVGALVHAGVCRDFLEPATASVVHERLRLAPECTVFDLSNACLGFANALCLVGSMIERGEIEAGLVVSGEDGGPLLEETLRALLADPRSGRNELKRAYASLTIGAGGDRARARAARVGAPLADAAHQLEPPGVELEALVQRSEALLELGRGEPLLGQLVREALDVDLFEAHGGRKG